MHIVPKSSKVHSRFSFGHARFGACESEAESCCNFNERRHQTGWNSNYQADCLATIALGELHFFLLLTCSPFCFIFLCCKSDDPKIIFMWRLEIPLALGSNPMKRGADAPLSLPKCTSACWPVNTRFTVQANQDLLRLVWNRQYL